MPKKMTLEGSLSSEAKSEILSNLEKIKNALSMLTSLDKSDIHSLMKVGNSYSPFIEKANKAVQAHPGIMPSMFELESYNKNLQFSKDLTLILDQLKTLVDGVENTICVVNSGLMADSLEVYSSAKLASDKVPGLRVVVDELSEFFKKHRRVPKKTKDIEV